MCIVYFEFITGKVCLTIKYAYVHIYHDDFLFLMMRKSKNKPSLMARCISILYLINSSPLVFNSVYILACNRYSSAISSDQAMFFCKPYTFLLARMFSLQQCLQQVPNGILNLDLSFYSRKIKQLSTKLLLSLDMLVY